MAKLTEKQKSFIEEYLIDLNATQAAIRAGYSSKTANEQGSRLLANVSIRACIDEALAERSKRTGINADRVLAELAKLGFVNAKDVVNFNNAEVNKNATDEDLAAIHSVKVKHTTGEFGETIEREVRMHDKIKSLELIGKHLGMFKEKVELEANVNTTAKLDSILEQLGD